MTRSPETPRTSKLHHVVTPPSLVTWFEHFSDAQADHVHFAPEDEQDLDRLVERLEATGGTSFVFHSSHRSLRRDAEIARRLRATGRSVLAQPPEVAELALDKDAMKAFFARHDVRTPPSPEQAPVGTRDWVVKPRLGTEGTGMRYAVGPPPECADGEYVEAFVPGIEFSVIAFVDGARVVTLPVVEKGWATPQLRPPYRRTRVCPPDPRHQAVVDDMVAVTRLLAARGEMQGWLEVEFVVDQQDRAWVLEINPRICGTMRLAAMCAQVQVFDLPGRDDLDGTLAASAWGAEVPWEGEPIADPVGRVFATSRLTVCASTKDELAARLADLGVDVAVDARRTSTHEYAHQLRRTTLTLIAHAKAGHPGSSLSAVDAIAVVYHRLHTQDVAAERDRFFLSKGHAAPALYAALILEGVIARSELASLRTLGSPLQGHPDPRFTPGVEGPSGSLGQGLSIAVGAALGLRRSGSLARVTVLVGDGECQEGQVWEAASFAAHHKLSNLAVVVDANGHQHDAPTRDIAGATDLAATWRSFGWETCVVDGHDVDALEAALRGSPGNRPRAVIARTIKGRGVSFMEGNGDWHSVFDADRLDEALTQVGGAVR